MPPFPSEDKACRTCSIINTDRSLSGSTLHMYAVVRTLFRVDVLFYNRPNTRLVSVLSQRGTVAIDTKLDTLQ